MGSGDVWVASPFPAPNSLFFHGRLNRNVANPFLPLRTPFPAVHGLQKPRGVGGDRTVAEAPMVSSQKPHLCVSPPPKSRAADPITHPLFLISFLLSEMGFYKNYRRLLWAKGHREDLGLAKNVGFCVPWG